MDSGASKHVTMNMMNFPLIKSIHANSKIGLFTANVGDLLIEEKANRVS